jgi:hypothetical protein
MPAPQASLVERNSNSAVRWVCRRCDRVVGARVLARWSVGLTDLDPCWICVACLAALRELAEGPAFGSLIDERPWAIEVLHEQGGSATPPPPRSHTAPSDREPSKKRRGPRRGAISV